MDKLERCPYCGQFPLEIELSEFLEELCTLIASIPGHGVKIDVQGMSPKQLKGILRCLRRLSRDR